MKSHVGHVVEDVLNDLIDLSRDAFHDDVADAVPACCDVPGCLIEWSELIIFSQKERDHSSVSVHVPQNLFLQLAVGVPILREYLFDGFGDLPHEFVRNIIPADQSNAVDREFFGERLVFICGGDVAFLI
ncbi:hypothetical protein ES703_89603 [subsurface metagenome]